MNRSREVVPLGSRPFAASVRVPGSKSITNRALICAAFASGTTRLRGAGLSDDSRHLAGSLRALGVDVLEDAGERLLTVTGLGGSFQQQGREWPRVYVGNAGTAARFLPCFVAAGSGSVLFESDERMRQRPMGPLLDCLRTQGATVASAEGREPAPVQGYPFVLTASGLRGGAVELDLDDSSQFASGLLMAAPYARAETRLRARGGRAQYPYVDMTAAVMEAFGVRVDSSEGTWNVAAGIGYRSPGEYRVEPDLSAAAYLFAAAALAPLSVTVEGVSHASLQGDLRFFKVLAHMGLRFYSDETGLTAELPPESVLRGGFTVDMNAFSDQVLTLAALAPFASAPIRIVHVAHIRRQECDRLAAIRQNLKTLGVEVREYPDGVEVFPWEPARRRGGTITSFGDHRVAMAFALLGLKVPGIVVDDADCVAKTFADYWSVMESLREAQAHGA